MHISVPKPVLFLSCHVLFCSVLISGVASLQCMHGSGYFVKGEGETPSDNGGTMKDDCLACWVNQLTLSSGQYCIASCVHLSDVKVFR